MSKGTYFNGHSHSQFSNVRLLDATIKEDQMIDKAIELGMAGIALTDHEILSGHLRAQKHLAKRRKAAETEEEKERLNNFKLVLGNEIYLVRNGLGKDNYMRGKDRYWHFILLAKDKIGHDQLRELSSRAWKRSYFQYLERTPTYYSDIEEVIGANPGHVVSTSACLGSFLSQLLLKGNYVEAAKFTDWAKGVFGSDFYIEIQPSLHKDQVAYNKAAVRFAQEQEVGITVATDAHYLTANDREVHKAFLQAKEGEREVDEFYSATYLMDWAEIERYLWYLNEKTVEGLRKTTLEIMDKCEEYSLAHHQVVPKVKSELFPNVDLSGLEQYTYITKFIHSPHEDDRALVNHSFHHLDRLNLRDQPHLGRMETELEEIWEVSERLTERLSSYLLTMAKIIDIAWNTTETLVGPGRGSSFVMLTCFLLGITQRDPLDSPLFLPTWRFLHKEKIELPDIDTDFQATKKDKLVEDVQDFFKAQGGDAVRIATFMTESSKSAIQTAARGLGMEPEMATYLSSLVPSDRGQVRSLRTCYYGDEEHGFAPVSAFVQEMENNPEVWKVAQSIEGLISRRSVHAAGILITNDDFVNRNALMKAPSGVLVSQFDLGDSEELGGIKYDLLVVDALDRIAVALNLLRLYGYIDWQGSLKETYDYYLSPKNLDYDSIEMWKMAADGKILNLFQFDTAVGGSAIRSIHPTSLLELGQANSLMRLMPEGRDKTPVQEFIDFKNDIDLFYDEINSLRGPQSQKEALIRHLEPLKGVADSQESLMLLVMDPDLTNFTVSEANFLRKTIAKKLTRDVDKLKDFLYTKGKDNGVSQEILNYIWNTQAARQMG